MAYDCDVSDVQLDNGLGSIDRVFLINIVIIFDILIVIWFTIHSFL